MSPPAGPLGTPLPENHPRYQEFCPMDQPEPALWPTVVPTTTQSSQAVFDSGYLANTNRIVTTGRAPPPRPLSGSFDSSLGTASFLQGLNTQNMSGNLSNFQSSLLSGNLNTPPVHQVSPNRRSTAPAVSTYQELQNVNRPATSTSAPLPERPRVELEDLGDEEAADIKIAEVFIGKDHKDEEDKQ